MKWYLRKGFYPIGCVKGEASINKVILSNVISDDSEVLSKEGFLSNGISVKGEASINKVILSNVVKMVNYYLTKRTRQT